MELTAAELEIGDIVEHPRMVGRIEVKDVQKLSTSDYEIYYQPTRTNGYPAYMIVTGTTTFTVYR